MSELLLPRRKSFLPIYTEANRVQESNTIDKGLLWLTSLMDIARQGEQHTWREPRTTLRASGTGDQCVRSLSLVLLGWQDIFSAKTLRVFSVGKAIEASVIEELRSAGILLDDNTEVQFNLPIPLVGFYDVMIAHPETNEKILGEIKSINIKGFEKLPEPSNNPQENFDNLVAAGQLSYLSQVTVYLQAVGLDHGFLLYEEKNAQKRKIFELNFNKVFFDSIIARLTEALEYAQKNEVAPRTRDVSKDKVCVWCSRKDLCVLLAKTGSTREDAVRIDAKLRGRNDNIL